MMTALMGDLRVIDLSQGWAGPLITEMLAATGAEVIKVEAVQRLDWWRGSGASSPYQPWYEASPLFNTVNRNKLGVTLDLTREEGRTLLKRLVRVGDVLIENFASFVMPRLGLTYEVLRAVKPDLVMISLPAFGGTGPWKDFSGFGWTTDALSGFTMLTGYEDSYPINQAISGDPVAALHGAVALFAAIEHVRSTGQGMHIDVSHIEAGTALLGQALMDYLMNRRIPPRRGNSSPVMAPHGVYRCAGEDNWIAIAVATDDDWACICRAMGADALAKEPRFADLVGRLRHRQELDAIIESWTKDKDKAVLENMLQAAGVAATAVMSLVELQGDPHLQARGFFEHHDHPVVGRHRYPRLPFLLSGAKAALDWPSPTLGQHNEPVLGQLLGLPRTELDRLCELTIIGTRPLA